MENDKAARGRLQEITKHLGDGFDFSPEIKKERLLLKGDEHVEKNCLTFGTTPGRADPSVREMKTPMMTEQDMMNARPLNGMEVGCHSVEEKVLTPDCKVVSPCHFGIFPRGRVDIGMENTVVQGTKTKFVPSNTTPRQI